MWLDWIPGCEILNLCTTNAVTNCCYYYVRVLYVLVVPISLADNSDSITWYDAVSGALKDFSVQDDIYSRYDLHTPTLEW